MRKMLAMAAIAAAGAAFAAVESDNVVGYQNLDLDNSGRNFIGATFLPVTGDMTLGDVTVNSTFVPLSDTLYTINSFGGASAIYFYVDADTASAFGGTAGWYLTDDINNWDGESSIPCQNETVLSVGQMVCVSASESGAALIFAGQVANADIELTLSNSGRNFLANCTPVDLTLGDIAVNATFVPLSDTLYTINSYGGASAIYFYVDADTASAFGGVAGWYLTDDINNWDGESSIPCQNSTAVTAGQGYVVSASESGAAIIIPSAL